MPLRYPHLLAALLVLALLTALLSSAGFTPTQAQALPASTASGAGHSSPQPGASVTTTTFPATMSENFESAWPSSGWTLSDLSSTDGGEYLWGRHNCNPHSGAYAGWSVGGGAQGSKLVLCANQPDYYPNNLLTRAVYGPFDLSGVMSATVTYYIWGSTEWDTIHRRDLCIYDSFTIEGYTDAGSHASNQYCGDWTHGSDGNGYYKETLNLSQLVGLGQGNAWLKLEFSSDNSNGDIGMLIDDITLSVTRPEPTQTPTVTPTTPPTTTTPTASATPSTPLPATPLPVYVPAIFRSLPLPTQTPLPPACDPFEPNDDRRVNPSGPLASGQAYQARICTGDKEDNYVFTTTTNNPVQISLALPATLAGNTVLLLYDSQTDMRQYLPNCGGLPVLGASYSATCKVPGPGRYVVRVYNEKQKDNDAFYTLRLTFQ